MLGDDDAAESLLCGDAGDNASPEIKGLFIWRFPGILGLCAFRIREHV